MPGELSHLVAGTALPDVSLPSTHGGFVSLAGWPRRAVVFFYPYTGRPGTPDPPNWDAIPGAHGSTPEAMGFRDRYEAFTALGTDIFGLSGQDTAWQREFAERAELPFALLSDSGFGFADALRLPRFETGGIAYLQRLTLIVADGKIADTMYPVDQPAAHAAEVLDKLSRR